MTEKKLREETKKLLDQFEFIDDSAIATLSACKHVDDLKTIHKYIKQHKYSNIYDIPKYAFYLYMKRYEPERILKNKE